MNEFKRIISSFQRIKGDQIQKQLKEEKDVMADQITALNTHIDAQEQVIKKLEERERSLQSTLVCGSSYYVNLIKFALHQVLRLPNYILSLDFFIFYNNCGITFLTMFIPTQYFVGISLDCRP
jgi:hypothetical protein